VPAHFGDDHRLLRPRRRRADYRAALKQRGTWVEVGAAAVLGIGFAVGGAVLLGFGAAWAAIPVIIGGAYGDAVTRVARRRDLAERASR
jgi:Na+-transporting methylmalonyl-CoA/oxaloacetate decarboxylase beta subunit